MTKMFQARTAQAKRVKDEVRVVGGVVRGSVVGSTSFRVVQWGERRCGAI